MLFCAGQAVQGHAYEHLQPELLHDDGVRSAQLLRCSGCFGPQLPFPNTVTKHDAFLFVRCRTLLTGPAPATGLLTSGQLVPAVRFVWQHPRALGSIFALSMAATTGEGIAGHPPSAACLTSVQLHAAPAALANRGPSVRNTFLRLAVAACLRRSAVHHTHHPELWRAAVCDRHDDAAVPVGSAVVPAVPPPAGARAVVSEMRTML